MSVDRAFRSPSVYCPSYGYGPARDYYDRPPRYELSPHVYQDSIHGPPGYYVDDDYYYRPSDPNKRRDYHAEASDYERYAALVRREHEEQRLAWIAAEHRRAQEAQRLMEAQQMDVRRARNHRRAGCTQGLAMHNPYDCQCSDCCDDVDFYTAAQGSDRAQKMLVGPTPHSALSRELARVVKASNCDLYKRLNDGKHFVCKVMKNAFGVSIDKDGKPREIRILRDILGDHRRLIKVNWWESKNSTTTIWYNYCSGGDLDRLVDAYITHESHIPEAFIWHVFLQLADAFAFIHFGYDRLSIDGRPYKGFKPIIHRDVKPANVFLKPIDYPNGYPNVVLADFGIATTQTSTNNLIGTMSYQPPEIPMHSREGDIWSLGACIHVLCTGSPPMSRPPKGVKPRDWDTNAKARVVADVTRYGYSKQLRNALYLVCRIHRSDRVIGKALIDKVSKLRDESGVKREPLAKWALKR
ncbi:MAG: hypothetical protein LQ350_003264 [Teloschistes chrysophthalmus]|nr:MAG: hypothetical protein LQ350_003264 [Niorma chrysophthalma]